MEISTILSISSAAIAFGAVLYTAINSAMNKNKDRYNYELKKVELDLMRKYFETSIYEKIDKLSENPNRWRDINHLIFDGSKSEFDDESVLSGKRSFLKSLGLDERITVRPGTAFVLTPFHPKFEMAYETVVAACQKIGLRAMRGDEEHISTPILPFVVERMLSSSIVIANIDGRNPNVFYELGIAHALNKDVIIISSSFGEVPFDLNSQRIVFWKTEEELARGLNKAVTQLYVHRERN